MESQHESCGFRHTTWQSGVYFVICMKYIESILFIENVVFKQIQNKSHERLDIS